MGINFGENVASTASGAPAIVSTATITGSTAMPLFVDNHGDAISFRVDDEAGDTSPFVVDPDGRVAIGSEFFSAQPEKLKVEADVNESNLISAFGDINNNAFVNVQNRNAGAFATSVLAATAVARRIPFAPGKEELKPEHPLPLHAYRSG